MDDVTRRRELADFLRTRRAKLVPSDIGLPRHVGRKRRVVGLRRDEVAQRAGISGDFYAWLEQARSVQMSRSVAHRLAEALHLDSVETDHLVRLADSRETERRTYVNEESKGAVLRNLRQFINALSPLPAYVMNYRWDIVAINIPAKKIFDDFGARKGRLAPNLMRYLFCDATAEKLIVGLPEYRTRVVGQFRRYADLGDASTLTLISDLCGASSEFDRLWKLHNVGARRLGRKNLEHPAYGRLSFDHGTFAIEENPGLRMVLYVPVDLKTRNTALQ